VTLKLLVYPSAALETVEGVITKETKDVRLHRALLNEFGYELDSNSAILDFGCGQGNMVREYRDAGFQAYGVDIDVSNEDEFLRSIRNDVIYRIPFDDNQFDFLFSNSVLEHVRDLDSALSEMYRVLKPGGASLHLFPPKAKPIEPHVFVPLATVVRNRPWLLVWAFFGIRNSFQKHVKAIDVARKNYAYLHNYTFYRSKRELREHICRRFDNLTFADREMIKNSYGSVRTLSPLIQTLPFLALLYGAFHNRCIFFEKPAPSSI
jgi:ubiquinone/menaquinone biosynthesis C-methylase UbiE